MKALIFAAGRGTRISRYLSGEPKCTVTVGDEKLIHYTVRMLKEKGVEDITLIVGYNHECIRRALSDMDVNFVYNPFFDVTNSIGSAWFARDIFGGDDMLFMNGDVFMEEKLIDQLVAFKNSGPVMFSDETRKEEADYKFYYKDGKLIDYGKELTGERITGEYIGVAVINKEFMPEFKSQLEYMISNQQHNVWWENVLYTLSDKKDIKVVNVAPLFWAEVDYIEDYERIKAFVGDTK